MVANGGSFELNHSAVRHNRASANGGGVLVAKNARFVARATVIEGNRAARGQLRRSQLHATQARWEIAWRCCSRSRDAPS